MTDGGDQLAGAEKRAGRAAQQRGSGTGRQRVYSGRRRGAGGGGRRGDQWGDEGAVEHPTRPAASVARPQVEVQEIVSRRAACLRSTGDLPGRAASSCRARAPVVLPRPFPHAARRSARLGGQLVMSEGKGSAGDATAPWIRAARPC